MKRGMSVFDRLLIGLLALGLIALGAGAASWQLDRLPFTLDRIGVRPILDASEQSWWPWALGGGGVVVVLIAWTLLIKQLPARSPKVVALPVTVGVPGSLLLDVDAVAKQAAVEAATIDGVASAKARTTVEKKLRVVTIDVALDSSADLRNTIDRLAAVRAELAEVVHGTPMAVRVLVSSK